MRESTTGRTIQIRLARVSWNEEKMSLCGSNSVTQESKRPISLESYAQVIDSWLT
jgi:hypothetical protein